VSFAREGLVFIAIAALVAAATYALALNRRSWPLWLLAFTLTIIALWVAYFFRDPQRSGPRGEQVVIARAHGKVVLSNEEHVNRYSVSRAVSPLHLDAGKFMRSIRSGSRADVFPPSSARAKVRVGGLTLAGFTEIADLGAR
jgi:phosphatidylserine decarboxylase